MTNGGLTARDEPGQLPREGSFIRWQATTITQLGYAVNLVLGLATAALGFSLTLVRDTNFVLRCWGKCSFLLSLLSLIASIAVGLICVLNRLHDFRKTAKIARDRETWESEKLAKEEIDRKLERRRAKTKEFGKRTWALLYWQTSLFAIGILLLVLTFVIAYRVKLLG